MTSTAHPLNLRRRSFVLG